MKLNISVERQEVFIKSTVWNSIIEVFNKEKNMDITKYLVSIQLRGNTILVKTTKPIIKSELFILDDKIKDLFGEKIKKIGINYDNYILKYI